MMRCSRVLIISAVCAGAILNRSTYAAAQRLPLPADSVQTLLSGLASDARNSAQIYLTGSDSAAQLAIREFRFDPNAGRLMLAIIEHEPSPAIRREILYSIPYYVDRWVGVPGIIPALIGRVARDSSADVVTAAVVAARAVAIAATGLEGAISDHMTSARATQDTALLRVLLEEDERLVHTRRRPVYAPAFVRTPPPPFAVVPADRPIRFSVFGDYGVAHIEEPRIRERAHQLELADVLHSYNAEHTLDFGISTGDNFYPTSFPTPTDPNWQITWANLYEPLGIPFYISLGNHDWYEETGAGPLAEYVYSRTSDSFKLPAFYYTYTAGPAQFFALNTLALSERQLEWLRHELARSTQTWKFVYGHFPIYEQSDYTAEEMRTKVLPLLEEFGVDAYFAGHHHSLQHWFVNGTDYIVAGAGGAPTYDLEDTTRVGRDLKFAESMPGFGIVEVDDSTFALRFVDSVGAVLYEYTRRK